MQIDEKVDLEGCRLLMADHPDKGIWYFTNVSRCAKYTDLFPQQVIQGLHSKRPNKGWTFEWVYDTIVPGKYIDPGVEAYKTPSPWDMVKTLSDELIALKKENEKLKKLAAK